MSRGLALAPAVPDLIGCREAAQLLHVSPDTVQRWAKQRKFPSTRIGGEKRPMLLFIRQDILDYIERSQR